jgi:hypothetical protein
MRARILIPLAGALALPFGCSPQPAYSPEALRQDTADAQAKSDSLQPAVGDYCGSMHLLKSGSDFKVELDLEVVEDNTHSSSSTDPTDTVQVPKLAGSMSFPAITNAGSAAYSSLPDLIQATGGYGTVSFSYGDYNPVNQVINLPFTLPGGQASYGSVNGTLAGTTFSGTWFSESGQKVGTFSLARCTEGSS